MTFDFIRASFPEAFSTGNQETPTPVKVGPQQFVPRKPESLAEAGIEPRDLQPLVVRYLYQHGKQSGLAVSRQLRLPLNLVEPTLHQLRSEQLLFPKGAAAGNDFVYEITPRGIEKAQLDLGLSTYCGAAPVSIDQYTNSVFRQSLRNHRIKLPQMIKALADYSVSNLLLSQLGQAVNSGKTLMLYGPPGTGKSVLSKQLLKAVQTNIWIPRVLSIGTEIIRVFDPSIHQELPFDQSQSLPPGFEIDHRWVYIQRPTIVAGGELELEHLEVTQNPITRILEAPIQVKSNCGCLVIDDFGRQRVGIHELLNRWIVPMDTGYDYIGLPSGRQIKLPFDQLLVFSTNFTPSKLTDEAFLRRIPYKIEVNNPTVEEFRELFLDRAAKFGVALEPGIVDYLIERHFTQKGRELRFCHAEDLLNQARDYCSFHDQQLIFDRTVADIAALNYFSQA
jgi:predicted ATPase with chaperone activity